MASSPVTMPEKKKPTRDTKRKCRDTELDIHPFRFPYFAHQQLDPAIFPIIVGLPIGRLGWAPAPQELADTSAWKDEDGSYDAQEDAGDDSAALDITNTANFTTASANPSKNPYKKLKASGGRPALAKKVTAELDSDDEIIVRMKQAKYLEKDIAQKLIDEGRIKYNAKTIRTRWARLRKKLQEKNDELLDAELTDWHDGDDEALQQAKKHADKAIEKLMAEVEAKRWKLVADNLKLFKPVTNFSQTACKARYKDLQEDVARPTPESNPNPDGETQARIAARREREARIERDRISFEATTQADPAQLSLIEGNWNGNAWTSKGNRRI